MVNHELAIKRKLSAIRSFYEFLFKNQRISANVTTLVSLPKIHEKPIIRLSQEEMVRMLEQSATGAGLSERQKTYQKLTAKRDFALISLFLGTGIRVSECVGLNISDVDLENNAFLVTRKGGKQVVLYFPPEVATALADYLDARREIAALPGHEDALFLSLQKRRITQRAVQNLVKKYASVAAGSVSRQLKIWLKNMPERLQQQRKLHRISSAALLRRTSIRKLAIFTWWRMCLGIPPSIRRADTTPK